MVFHYFNLELGTPDFINISLAGQEIYITENSGEYKIENFL
jgi:hypothetical protein